MNVGSIDNLKAAELIGRIALNDMAALEEFYVLTEKCVYAIAMSYVSNSFDAADIKQDVFIRVKSYADKFDGKNAMGWLYTITKNTALNFKKKRKRENVSIDDISESAFSSEMSGTRSDLSDALKRLPSIERQIVLYHLYLGYKHNEIAELIGKPLTTVKFYYLRAIKKLQGMLKTDD